MEPAFDEEGEVLRAGQVGNRGEVAGDDASGYTSPAEGRDNGEAEGDCRGYRSSRAQKVQTGSGHPAATIQGRRCSSRQQGRLEPCRPRRATG
jgi:hypothetical protein